MKYNPQVKYSCGENRFPPRPFGWPSYWVLIIKKLRIPTPVLETMIKIVKNLDHEEKYIDFSLFF
jgi:hypothetical protein